MRLFVRKTLLSASTILASGLLLVPLPALALPQDGVVVGGSATIGRGATTRLDVVQHSNTAVINWESFGVGAEEWVRFVQPSADASVLNRVVGDDLSVIAGRLSGNGRIFLVNPNGVLFTATGRVDAGAFVASTADVTTSAFMAGRLDFDRPSTVFGAGIVNRGTISVADRGLAALVAPSVANHGLISARLGDVVLAGARTFTLDLYGDGLIAFDATSTVSGVLGDAALAGNAGTISANGGSVLVTAAAAEGLVNDAVNTSGVIEARGVSVEDGEIVLHGGAHGTVVASGTVDASGRGAGQTGGTIKVLGERVGLTKGARLDASGAAGGGTVLVGGDWQGRRTEQAATMTVAQAGSTVRADALRDGDGGKVVLWSDDRTVFSGAVSAKGAGRGDGGKVEVSGKQDLGFSGRVDVSAAEGRDGQILLDPWDLVIARTGSATDGTELFGDAGSPLVIAESALESLSGDVVLQASNDITIRSNLSGGLDLGNRGIGQRVVFQAGRHINVGSSIRTGGADLWFEADSPHVMSLGGDGDGALRIADVDIDLDRGKLTMIAADLEVQAVRAISARGGVDVADSRNGQSLVVADADLPDLASSDVGRVTFGTARTAGDNGLGANAQRLQAGAITIASDLAFDYPLTVFTASTITVDARVVSSGRLEFTAGGVDSAGAPFRVTRNGYVDSTRVVPAGGEPNVRIQAADVDIRGRIEDGANPDPRGTEVWFEAYSGATNSWSDIQLGASGPGSTGMHTFELTGNELDRIGGDVWMNGSSVVTVGPLQTVNPHFIGFSGRFVEIDHALGFTSDDMTGVAFVAEHADDGTVEPLSIGSSGTVSLQSGSVRLEAADALILGDVWAGMVNLLPYTGYLAADLPSVLFGSPADSNGSPDTLEISNAELARLHTRTLKVGMYDGERGGAFSAGSGVRFATVGQVLLPDFDRFEVEMPLISIGATIRPGTASPVNLEFSAGARGLGFSNSAPILSGGGHVRIRAWDAEIGDVIHAAGGDVDITGMGDVSLGARVFASPNMLLTQAELDNLSGDVLLIEAEHDLAVGSTISADQRILVLQGETVTATLGGIKTGNLLLMSDGGAIRVTHADTDVDRLAVMAMDEDDPAATIHDITFSDADGFAVGSMVSSTGHERIDGITARNVLLQAANGTVAFEAPSPGAPEGAVTVTAKEDLTVEAARITVAGTLVSGDVMQMVTSASDAAGDPLHLGATAALHSGVMAGEGIVLDAADIRIDSGAKIGTSGGRVTFDAQQDRVLVGGAGAGSALAGSFELSTAELAGLLNHGVSVEVFTPGTITLAGTVVKSAGGDAALWLNAYTRITVNAPATRSSSSSSYRIASRSGQLDVGLASRGLVDIRGAGTAYAIGSNGGDVTVQGRDVVMQGRAVRTGGGAAAVLASGGDSWATIGLPGGGDAVIDAGAGAVVLGGTPAFARLHLDDRAVNTTGLVSMRAGTVANNSAGLSRVGSGYSYGIPAFDARNNGIAEIVATDVTLGGRTYDGALETVEPGERPAGAVDPEEPETQQVIEQAVNLPPVVVPALPTVLTVPSNLVQITVTDGLTLDVGPTRPVAPAMQLAPASAAPAHAPVLVREAGESEPAPAPAAARQDGGERGGGTGGGSGGGSSGGASASESGGPIQQQDDEEPREDQAPQAAPARSEETDDSAPQGLDRVQGTGPAGGAATDALPQSDTTPQGGTGNTGTGSDAGFSDTGLGGSDRLTRGDGGEGGEDDEDDEDETRDGTTDGGTR